MAAESRCLVCRHRGLPARCPLLGHKRTFAVQTVMSGLPLKADMRSGLMHRSK
jgi:hypothetical protein